MHPDASVETGSDGSDNSVAALFEEAFQWAKRRDFAGHDPYDGLNSPILSPLRRNWLTRLVGMHAVRMSPVNLRGILGVPRERNPKAIGLFADACLLRYEQTGQKRYLEEAESLLEWLEGARTDAFEQPAWGYNFDWQSSRKFYLPAFHPCVVVTVFCGRAFVRHYRLTGDERSLELATGAAQFIRDEINTVDVDGVDALSYTPYDSFVVVNANALAADYLYTIGRLADDGALVSRAEELFEFVVDAQVDNGGWFYAVPADESHLDHDNFHTGFVLESLHDYAMAQPVGHPARIAYERGMGFYRSSLFEPTGAPKFQHDQSLPYDVHGAAQAIITFSQHATAPDLRTAERVLEWTRRRLYDQEGYFYRRVGRFGVDETPYMRWSQAWMCRALAGYLAGSDGLSGTPR
ncbi:MAG: hypothetical protein V5A46_01180 [Haloferacaceae archaeon]